MFNLSEEQVSGRQLSLFCLDDNCQRMYLENLEKQDDSKGNIYFNPILTAQPEKAYSFPSISMASQYSSFLKDNLNIEFFYCILPEFYYENQESNNEDEKALDRTD